MTKIGLCCQNELIMFLWAEIMLNLAVSKKKRSQKLGKYKTISDHFVLNYVDSAGANILRLQSVKLNVCCGLFDHKHYEQCFYEWDLMCVYMDAHAHTSKKRNSHPAVRLFWWQMLATTLIEAMQQCANIVFVVHDTSKEAPFNITPAQRVKTFAGSCSDLQGKILQMKEQGSDAVCGGQWCGQALVSILPTRAVHFLIEILTTI